METRFICAERGHGNFALRSFAQGDVLLTEHPTVICQRVLSSTVAGGLGIRSCSVCLGFMDLPQELSRLLDVPCDDLQETQTSCYQWHSFFFNLGFCGAKCLDDALGKRGIGYLLLSGPAGKLDEMDFTSARAYLRHTPLSADVSARYESALSRMAHLHTNFNERVLQVAQILCKLMAEAAAAAAAGSSDGKERFDTLLDKFVDAYAEGGHQKMRDPQRGVIRQAHEATQSWMDCCWAATFGPLDEVSCCRWTISVQRYLQLCWLLDANVHSCVVINPIWLELGQQQQQQQSQCRRSDETPQDEQHNEVDHIVVGGGAKDVVKALSADPPALLKLLRRLGLASSKGSDGDGEGSELPATSVHNMGVALYDKATKFNHSCDPNVRFVPTLAPARAIVVAKRAIEVGEELLTSYIDLSDPQFESVERRRAALSDYGFQCDCVRCLREEECSEEREQTPI